MKVLFIQKESNLLERLGVMYLSSALKLRGHRTKMILADRFSQKKFMAVVKSYAPDIIGYSAMNSEHRALLDINRGLKRELKFVSVFGGAHPTFCNDLIEEDGVDAVCVGEADKAFPEFCQRLEDREHYHDAPNFIVKNGGSIIANRLSDLIEDLDALPFPDRELMYEADPLFLDRGVRSFLSSRGCVHECAYCFNHQYNEIYKGKGNVIRYRSPGSLLREIQEVRLKYGLQMAYICDDAFFLKPSGWFREFSRSYKEHIDIPLSCNIRADNIDEATIASLKDAGLGVVFMGIECADEGINNSVLRRNIRNEAILEAVRILKKYNIKIVTLNILGLPIPNSYKTDISTLDFNIRMKPAFARSSLMFPYPGTYIESCARSKGFLKIEKPYRETYHSSTAFNFSKGEKRRIENLHKLFCVIVNFPFLRRFSGLLCSLPLGLVYTPIFYFWYGYCYNSMVGLLPDKGSCRGMFGHARMWLKAVRKR